MATRKKTRRTPAKRPSSARRPARPTLAREPLVSPEAAQTISAIVLWLIAAVLLLGLLGIGGPLGQTVTRWTGQAIGWTDWFLPPLLVWYGWNLLNHRLPRHMVVGSTLVLISLCGLLELFHNPRPVEAALHGTHGGLLGYSLLSTVSYALGSIGAGLLFLAVGAIGVFVTLNRSLRSGKPPDATASSDAGTQKPEPVPVPDPTAKPSPIAAVIKKQAAAEPDFQPRVVDAAWEQPPLSLLSNESSAGTAGDTNRAAQIIETTLRNFNIAVQVENVNVGPSVTQYELRPDPGVKLNQITALSNDLALALAAHPIRIEAPIPGKSTVGIEVPNLKPAMVRLRKLYESDAWKRGGALPMALGEDVSGEATIADLATMPHLLIAGATGAGKSVGINTILMSLLYTHSPKHLRLLLVDPKRVELTLFNDIPHLIAPVIVEAPKVVNALKWVVSEMDRRYKVFQERRVKNLSEFNNEFPDETMPYLVVVIDELADLMQVSGKAVEGTIVRIAQLARATGIHLILATQRPSVDVITGLIKANFPSRIAFTVSSATDSRTILDSGGAEKLLGRGDMLFQPGNVAKPIRVQGAFVENSEVKKLTDFLKGKGAPSYEENVTEKQSSGGLGGGDDDESDDPLYDEARAEVVRSRKASASFLQRRLKVGYARAARLLDMMEENGVVGPGEGAKPREILVEPEDLE